jgi:ribosomal protein L44E
MGSKDDIARAIKTQFPHARIDSITETNPRKAAAERSQTKKRSEERKWQEGEYGRYDRARPKHRPNANALSLRLACTADEYERIPAVNESGKKLIPIVYRSRNGEITATHWVDPDNVPDPVMPPSSLGCTDSTPWLYRTNKKPSRKDLPPYPTMACRRAPEFVRKGIRLKESFTTRRGAQGGIRNENIGGQMQRHGEPSVVAHMRATGQLRVLRDETGNHTEYLVSSSRKHQAEQIKEYNRRQIEAEARGWKGTRSANLGYGVKIIRHGGNTTD